MHRASTFEPYTFHALGRTPLAPCPPPPAPPAPSRLSQRATLPSLPPGGICIIHPFFCGVCMYIVHTQVLAEHFYREGRFDLGDLLAREAQLTNPDSLKAPYSAMHTILTQASRP